MITCEGITCQLKLLKKMTEIFFLANSFNKFARKISYNIRIFSSVCFLEEICSVRVKFNYIYFH